jgi:choice-of-anchor A domain-containing protein
VDAPADAVVVVDVDVSGASYDMNAGGTAVEPGAGAQAKNRLLWNFKDATKVVKKS